MSTRDTVRDEYSRRFGTILEPLATRLSRYLNDLVVGQPRVDSVRVRAKSIDRFATKANKHEGRHPKYSDPLNQIQDQMGARIVVFYPADVDRICDATVKRYFRFVEERSIVPESPSEFGYEGKHFILFIPPDVLDGNWAKGDYPTFFEMQVKTLFQHSWAEANHDLAYKASTELTVEQRRKVAFSAAQAWGADLIFQDLAEELHVLDRA
jgi:putative GTP pyrophosphokinase